MGPNDSGLHFEGLLVTAGDDPHRPIALVMPVLCDGPKAEERDAALIIARRVAADLSLIGDEVAVRDLRQYGRLDSRQPTPAHFYGWRLCEPGAGGFDAFPFLPFCRFRLARFVAAYAALRFDAEDRKAMPHPMVGLMKPRDEDGNCSQIEFDPIVVPAHEVPL